MAREPRRRQWGAAIGGEGAAHGAPGAPHAFRLVVGPSRPLPCERPDAPPPLWQACLGMAIGVRDGRGGGTPGRACATAARLAGGAVRDAPDHRPLERLRHLVDPLCQSVVGGRAPTPGQQDLA